MTPVSPVALYLVATPIGEHGDLSPRAIEILLRAKLVIGEEFRPLTTLLKRIGRERDEHLTVLNEHSKPDDVKELADRVQAIAKDGGYTALISDCGTPGFCDPGAPLVASLRKRGLRTSSVPGASSLMCLLSVAGVDLRQFVFAGFLPVEKGERTKSLQDLKRERRPIVVMDTPYRLERLLSELAEVMPERRATLGCEFTTPDELVTEDSLARLKTMWESREPDRRKAEFMILVHATRTGPPSIGQISEEL